MSGTRSLLVISCFILIILSLVFCIHFHFPWKIICECFQLSSHLLPVPLLSSVNILSQSTPCPCSILPIGYVLLQYVFPVGLVFLLYWLTLFFYIVSVKQNSLLVYPSCFSAGHTASPDIIRYVSSLIALCIFIYFIRWFCCEQLE